MRLAERVEGCLLAGAAGDAIGGVVEFDQWSTIRARYGERGIDRVVAPGWFTDDTQMTLFTVDGVIRAIVGGGDPVSEVHRAYRRWLHTQSYVVEPELLDGWLIADRRLYRRQAPGMTCLSALQTGLAGTPGHPLNDSKGCGAVMRVAPIGLAYPLETAWELGCATGALTHGHPDGWQPAGALATMIAGVCEGEDLATAVAIALRHTSGNTHRLLGEAVAVAKEGRIDAAIIKERLGEGWTGDEALAIAVACALGCPVAPTAILTAVNHSGDSDSTGAICGNIVGALQGASAVPRAWIETLDALDILRDAAEDLVAAVHGELTTLGGRYANNT
jgi:ADP-ribosylglycohydrolase